MKFITIPFSWLLLTLYNFTNNYGVAIILFGLIVKFIMLPFMMKSKLSTMRQSRLAPRLKDLQKRYEGNQQKYQEEVSKLYKEENIRPLSGCLWTLIPFPILIALYSVIRQPLSKLMSLTTEQVETVRDTLVNMGLYTIPEKADAYVEITYADIIHNNFSAVTAKLPELAEKLKDIDFSFIGLNLGDKPSWRFFLDCDWSSVSSWLPALGLFLIPIVSALLSLLQIKISSAATPVVDEQAAQSSKMMTYMMPLVSLWIGFVMPAALGIYWIVNSVFAIFQDMWLNKKYTKLLDAEDAERIERQKAKEAELEKKRQETEKLRAEGATVVNKNTSRRKRQTAERTRNEERIAAEKAALRAAKEPEVTEEDSRVGNRKYARGRAYVADRFTNPAAAAAVTVEEPEAESEQAEVIEEAPASEVVSAVPELTPAAEEEEASAFVPPVFVSPEYAAANSDEEAEEPSDGEDQGVEL